MSSLDYLDLCRLCLVKDRVSVPIFEGEGDVRQIFLKITACLPVKVNREDKLPKKICDDCVYKVELCYQFWHTTVNAEKQLLQWLGEVNMEDKQGYNVLNPNGMKPDQSNENRLDGTVMQQVSDHQNNMNMNMMDNMGLSMPMMMSNTQQQITSVPMDNSSSVQNVQPVAGPSTQATHDQITQNQTEAPTQQEEEEESSEEEENSDDECDGDEGLPIKEESEEDPNNSRTIEPTTFVNVSLACDEAGPSGLQQQKIADMPEMVMPQTADVDPKTGYFVSKLTMLPQDRQQCGPGEIKHVFTQGQLLIADPLHTNPKMETTDILAHESVLQCEFCGDSFTSDQDLSLHLETHESEERAQPQRDEQLVCEKCGCSFMSTPELREHQKEHGSEECFTCDNCDYVTSNRESLIAHERCHISDYKYQCEVCGEQFQSKGSCQVHLLSHARDKPFQCDICNATFRYRQGLRLHTKLHQPDYVPPQRKHHCELCNKRFSRKQVLLVHMKTHGNVGPQNEYVCTMCGKSVSSKTYLAVHLRKHTGEKPHVCDICGKGFISQNYLSVHRRTHTGEKPHQCIHCNKRFTQRTTLVVHLRGHTGDRPYPCTCCHKSFASKTMLNSHLKTHAKQSARQQQEQQQQQVQQHHESSQQQHELQQQQEPLPLETVTIVLTKEWRTSEKKSLVKREDQGASFVILQEIDDETILVQEVTTYHCDSCNEDFDTKASLIVHRTEQSILRTREALRQAKKKHECDICRQTFSKKFELIKHRQIRCMYPLAVEKKQIQKKNVTVVHPKLPPLPTGKDIVLRQKVTKIKRSREENKESSAGPIECDQCHKVFKKKRYLDVHKALHGAPHICHVCGAKLTSDYYLKIHIRRHNKEFTEFCEICNKGFYLKANLKTHMSVHTDEKPCICEICHKSFGNRIYLRSHMKIHIQPETRKKYKCEICSFETFYNYCYKEHMWTHTGENQVACEVCGKLISRQYMKTHIRIHTGEKPEICEFCGKAFSARKYLIKHRRTHTGEKPYQCKICEKRFNQRGTLSAHLRRHENPK